MSAAGITGAFLSLTCIALIGGAAVGLRALEASSPGETVLTSQKLNLDCDATRTATVKLGDATAWRVERSGEGESDAPISAIFVTRTSLASGRVVDSWPHRFKSTCRNCGPYSIEVHDRHEVQCPCGRDSLRFREVVAAE